MHKKSQYENLISHLEAQLETALLKEAELKAIWDEASSKVPFITVDTSSGKVSGRQLTGATGEAVKLAGKNIEEHKLKIIGSIKGDIKRAEEVMTIIDRANYDIGEIKFSFSR